MLVPADFRTASVGRHRANAVSDHIVANEEDKNLSWSLMSSTFMPSEPSEPAKSISPQSVQCFQRNALFFNFFMLKLKLPVEETEMSISGTTISIPSRRK